MADDATIATSSQNLHDRIDAQIKRGVPTFFKLEAQLPPKAAQIFHSPRLTACGSY